MVGSVIVTVDVVMLGVEFLSFPIEVEATAVLELAVGMPIVT